jgi:hypothetical protein
MQSAINGTEKSRNPEGLIMTNPKWLIKTETAENAFFKSVAFEVLVSKEWNDNRPVEPRWGSILIYIHNPDFMPGY